MAADIHQIIAALKPDLFCKMEKRGVVKKILRRALPHRNQELFQTAAEAAELLEPNGIDLERAENANPFTLPGFKAPVERHSFSYDSLDESLESFYFRFLDSLSAGDWTLSKLEDTFVASPGSGLFSETTRRQSQAQNQAMNLLRQADFLVHDILRTAAGLQGTKHPAEGPLLSDLSRSEVDRIALKTKIQTLKLYARWLGPYLRQARQLEQHGASSSDAVSLFNTAIITLTTLAQRDFPLVEQVDKGELPRFFLRSKHRVCDPVLIMQLRMRAAPERLYPGAFGYRGRLEITLTSYALNQEEILVLHSELEQANLRDLVSAVGGDAIATLNETINKIDELMADPVEATKPRDDPNPFLALLGLAEHPTESEVQSSDGKKTTLGPWDLRADSEIEAVIRSQALLEARRRCLEIYNACKTMLNMPVF